MAKYIRISHSVYKPHTTDLPRQNSTGGSCETLIVEIGKRKGWLLLGGRLMQVITQWGHNIWRIMQNRIRSIRFSSFGLTLVEGCRPAHLSHSNDTMFLWLGGMQSHFSPSWMM